MEKIENIKLEKDMKVGKLVEQMKKAGFGARKIGKASEIAKKMFKDDCRVFLGLAGAMVPGGMRKIILDLLDKTDVFVTTGANLTHDLIEALGDSHYHCDEWNDEEFNKKGYDRIYNVLMKNEVYEKLEGFFKENWSEFSDCNNIKEFLLKLGEILSKRNLGKDSILRKCYEKNIPVFCPAISDSGIGLMVWGRRVSSESKDSEIMKIDAFDDMKEIIDIAWTSKQKGVIYIGGGVPKNFIQQSLQFSSGADYGIQITTDRQESGGSSGAPLEEGKSWGKLKKDADFVDVSCDATIALPLIFCDID